MPFIDTNALRIIEGLPGWYGRYLNSTNMTFAHYDSKEVRPSTSIFILKKKSTRSSKVNSNQPSTAQSRLLDRGLVGIAPSNVRHSVKALTDGRAFIVDYPLTTDAVGRSS